MVETPYALHDLLAWLDLPNAIFMRAQKALRRLPYRQYREPWDKYSEIGLQWGVIPS